MAINSPIGAGSTQKSGTSFSIDQVSDFFWNQQNVRVFLAKREGISKLESEHRLPLIMRQNLEPVFEPPRLRLRTRSGAVDRSGCQVVAYEPRRVGTYGV